MNKETRKQYGPIKLLDIECSEPYGWESADATHIRVSLPPSYRHQVEMTKHGYFFADRTLAVSIDLQRSKLNFDRLIRMEPQVISDRRDDVRAIAYQSFPTDRRFHLGYEPDPAVAATVLSGWIDELQSCYLCTYKDKAIGFLALTGEGTQRFVHLAAVLEQYRITGAGMSLYAAAARDCKNAGVRFLQGRISSVNTAVMNLYASLGAVFSDPLDVYLKEV